MCGGSVTSAGLLQRTSSAPAALVGCRPLSQWLSTSALLSVKLQAWMIHAWCHS